MLLLVASLRASICLTLEVALNFLTSILSVTRLYLYTKRTADFLVAVSLSTLLAPLTIPIIFALRMTGEGEVLYKQPRIGYRGRYFNILKFATMLKDSPNIGTGDITLRNDPRITPLGGFLRKSKLNELPQLLNVINGDLSLVGPRPLMSVSFKMYTPEVQQVIYESPPGITGLGSVVYRDEESLVTSAVRAGIDSRDFYSQAIYPYKGKLELYYHKHRGFWVDCKILLATAVAVLVPHVDFTPTLFPDLPPRPSELSPQGYLAKFESG